MTIVGFNYTRMEVEKKEATAGKINISNNVSIKDVSAADLSIGTQKQKAIKFSFEFTSKYEPNVGSIKFEGDLLFLADAEKTKKILDDWKKHKRVEKDIMSSLLNSVLSKCNVQALILSQEVNLPSPIPLPKVKMDETK